MTDTMQRKLARFTVVLVCVAVSSAVFSAPAGTTGTGILGQRHAIIVQNTGPGLAIAFRDLLLERGRFEEGNILCYGQDEPFTRFCLGGATAGEFSSGLAEIMDKMSERDTLLVLLACHMQKGFLINDTLSYAELNSLLSEAPEAGTVLVIVEGCHAGAAIPVLNAADVVYASAGPDEPCYGGWLHFFLDALGRKEDAFSSADADDDGFVSFGEAYDYAADEERLGEWYSNLSRDVWPPKDFHPTPLRTENGLQYNLFLNPSAPTPF